MSRYNDYPANYRSREVNLLLPAIQAGECAAVLGLSGAGKSNLMGFLAQRVDAGLPLLLVDCNRLDEPSPAGFFRLLTGALAPDMQGGSLAALEEAVESRLARPPGRLCLLLDRFDALPPPLGPLYNNLRSLRDGHKYDLCCVIAARRPPDPASELAELFFANTLWLGPLSLEDACWSARQFARRRSLDWPDATLSTLVQISGGYPAWLRAACEAYAAGCALEVNALRRHPAVQRRLDEFWESQPTPEHLSASRLNGIPLLEKLPTPLLATNDLTASELRLLQHLQTHPGEVCSKDDLIRAVWPEDVIFSGGMRDDSLAQLVRRLREKIETQPSSPRHLLTVPGRGYRFV